MPGYKLHMLLKRPCPAGLLPMLAMVLLRETQAWTSATSLKLSGNAILTGFCRLGSKTLKLFKIGSLLPLPHRKWAEVTETVKGRHCSSLFVTLANSRGKWVEIHLLLNWGVEPFSVLYSFRNSSVCRITRTCFCHAVLVFVAEVLVEGKVYVCVRESLQWSQYS